MTPTSRELAVVAVVSAVVAVPLWACRFPVGQDLPAHVETAAQIVSLWRGGGDISAHYQMHAWPWPNSLPTVLLAALMVGIEGLFAAKLLLSAALLLWPLSIAVFLQRMGRSGLFALALLPTAYDLSFAYGFFHFVLGKPLWMLAIILAVDVGRRPTRRRAVQLLAALVALFSTHLLLFISALPLSVLSAAVSAWRAPSEHDARGLRGRGAVVGLAMVALSMLPFARWYASTAHPPKRDQDVALPLADALSRLWDNLGNLSGTPGDAWSWILGGVVVVAAVVVGAGAAVLDGRAKRRATAAHNRSRDVSSRTPHVSPQLWEVPRAAPATNITVPLGGSLVLPWILGLCVMGFALLGPIKTATASVIAERFSALGVALLCCALLPRRQLSGVTRVVVIVAGVVVVVAQAQPTLARFRAFNAEQMGDFDALVDRVPAGAVVATHFVWPLSRHGRFNALWHWPKLVSRRGAVTDDSFAFRDTCVVGVAPGAAPPRRRPFVAGRPIQAMALQGFDHLLVQGQDRRFARAQHQGLLNPIATQGVWTLYHVAAPAPPVAPAAAEDAGGSLGHP